MNFASTKNTLKELKDVISQITDVEFTTPIPALSQATIGEHCRHIIELYQALLHSYTTDVLNYDNRARNVSIQTQKITAIDAMEQILEAIEKNDKKIMLEHLISGVPTVMETTYFREVLYNLEHCIHHQALIKVALIQLGTITVSENFGVAPSTLEYRNACAQ
ncbi:DinB family protein [Flavobacterium sp.]|uniref:DinB family protein n=1 Tax=Flavobacterium sp. TaxID=239 RepID=UPI003D0D195D